MSWCVQKRLLMVMGAIGLSACGLNHNQIAERIQADIVTNGGTSLKAVTCPKGVKPEAGKTFECVGEMDNGYTFTIPVQQQDGKGNVTWDVPHAKGLINVPKLQALMQETLTAEVGTNPSINCGGIYKPVTPGEGFECQLAYKVTKQPTGKSTKGKSAKPGKPIEVTQTEKITITTDDKGNVSWQRVLPGLAAK